MEHFPARQPIHCQISNHREKIEHPAHVVGSRKCKECNERAQALCKLCGNWKASAGIADHENRCREKKKNEESDAIRVAYVT